MLSVQRCPSVLNHSLKAHSSYRRETHLLIALTYLHLLCVVCSFFLPDFLTLTKHFMIIPKSLVMPIICKVCLIKQSGTQLIISITYKIHTFCVSGSINQFQAPVAVQTDTTIRITETRKGKLTNCSNINNIFVRLSSNV